MNRFPFQPLPLPVPLVLAFHLVLGKFLTYYEGVEVIIPSDFICGDKFAPDAEVSARAILFTGEGGRGKSEDGGI